MKGGERDLGGRVSLAEGTASIKGLRTGRRLAWSAGDEQRRARLKVRPGRKLDHVGSWGPL